MTDDDLSSTWVSTLPTAPLPFEHIGLIIGIRAPTMALALENLQRRAIEVGASAVLGAGFVTAPDLQGQPDFIGYGTAIRWTVTGTGTAPNWPA